MKKYINPALLNLSDAERRIFQVLTEPLLISEIAARSGVPRTSIAYVLHGLISRGMVETVRHGKRVRYVRVSKEALAHLTDDVRTFFDPTLAVLTVPHFDGLRVYRGIPSMVAEHVQLIRAQLPRTRVKVIQPNASFLAQFTHARVDDVIALNHALSESKIILDGIIEAGAYEAYEAYWKLDPEGFERLNPTFLNRTTDYVELRSASLPFTNELWLFDDTVLIVNWSAHMSVVITNTETRGLLSVLYDTLKATGTRVDHAAEITKRGTEKK